jgi:hypothetical protein
MVSGDMMVERTAAVLKPPSLAVPPTPGAGLPTCPWEADMLLVVVLVGDEDV